MKLALALLACALSAAAAGIHGHWNVETVPSKNAAADRLPATYSLDLKIADGVVSGTVALPAKKRPQFQTVENARFDGSHLTFTTTSKGKKSVTLSWDATFRNDQLAGTFSREGAKGSKKFIAKRN